MMQETDLGAATLQRHLERLDGQMAIIAGTDYPRDDKP